MNRATLVLLLLALALLPGCGGSSGQPDAGTDTDANTDMDAGGDTDTDIDADGDTDSDTGSDTATDTDNDGGMSAEDYDDVTPVEWVEIPGGTFMQGNDTLDPEFYTETPIHEVTVPSFEMMTTEVTASQYAQCFLADYCDEPSTDADFTSLYGCTWLVPGEGHHPINCVEIGQATAYCEWIDARLPSESEWEYAARGAGQENEYPWGEDEPNCELTVMYDLFEGIGCGLDRTWPVCSKTAGNTEHGLCDMAGNVWEWVPDCWYGDYYGAPTDGSVSDEWPCSSRVLRGGGWKSPDKSLRTRTRFYKVPIGRSPSIGFRCARDVEPEPDGGVDAGPDGGE